MPNDQQYLTMPQVREELFNAATAAAIDVATKPGDYLINDRCVAVVHEVFKIMDGKAGYDVPVFQMFASPSPEFQDYRARQEQKLFPNDGPIDVNRPQDIEGQTDYQSVSMAEEYRNYVFNGAGTQATKELLSAQAVALFD